MSISKAIAALFSHDEEDSQIRHSSLTALPTWVLVLFVAGVLWLAHGVLTETNLRLIFWLALAYIGGEYLLRIVLVIVNGANKRAEITTFDRDNSLDANEAAVLMQRKTTTETVSKTPAP